MTPARGLLRENPAVYTSCYCEENVWRLLGTGVVDVSRSVVIFISNPRRTVAVHHQLASGPELALDDPWKDVCVWDYHVILAERRTDDRWYVWDLDSKLEFPCPIGRYVSLAFREGAPRALCAQFRVVNASRYRDMFGSDRSHMIDATTGRYMADPPNTPPIRPEASNLAQWWTTTDAAAAATAADLDTGFGVIVESPSALLHLLSSVDDTSS